MFTYLSQLLFNHLKKKKSTNARLGFPICELNIYDNDVYFM